MSETVPIGKCLCGNVTVKLSRAMDDVGVCHCSKCLQWNSGPWMALQDPDAKVSGDGLKIYSSSSFAERGFCSDCGTHIFHRPKEGPELAVSAGLFQSPKKHIAREIFTDSKSKFYDFLADSKKQTQFSMALEWIPKMAGRKLKRWIGG